MSQKVTFIIAASLTAFLLVIGGAVVSRVAQTTTASAAIDSTSPVDAPASTDVQALLDREAAYQELIRQANERLAKANSSQNTVLTNRLSGDQAVQIALQAVPKAAVMGRPELSNYQGILAYEVTLNTGLVYVDASNGQILANGAEPISFPPGQILTSNGSDQSTGTDSQSRARTNERASSERSRGDGGDDGGGGGDS